MGDPRQAPTNRTERDPSGDRLDRRSGNDRRSEVDWRALVAWITSGAASLSLIVAGWASGRIMAHETAIEVLRIQQVGIERRLDSIDGKLDRALDTTRQGKIP